MTIIADELARALQEDAEQIAFTRAKLAELGRCSLHEI
jgi:hypothetical protein